MGGICHNAVQQSALRLREERLRLLDPPSASGVARQSVSLFDTAGERIQWSGF
jgi:hypothetical protein